MSLIKVIGFYLKFGGPKAYLKHYGRLLQSYGRAWDSGDIEGILHHFGDEFIYTDPIAQGGIFNKSELKHHLVHVFLRFPEQKWTTNATIYPHFTLNRFAISYEFSLKGEGAEFTGTGMEKITFKNDKLIEDRIHLQFKELDSRPGLGIQKI